MTDLTEREERATELALELLKLGVSDRMVVELLGYPHDEIERQLLYLPYRKAKRPEAFIVDAIRNHYSAPKEFYLPQQSKSHAQTPNQAPHS